MKRTLSLILLLTLFTTLQSHIYTINHLGTKNGLSNNNVVGIAQDKKGCLWFATEEGLNRLDGKKITSFHKEQHKIKGLSGNELNCVVDDLVDSILWIGTQREGLNAYNYAKNEFFCYQHNPKDPNSLITNDITDIASDSNGNLWIGTYWKGVDYYDKHNKTFSHFNSETVEGLENNQVWTVLDDGNGLLYIGHVNSGLSIVSIKDRKAKNYKQETVKGKSLPSNSIHAIYQDKNGYIWLGTGNGLALYNPKKNDFIAFKDEISSLSHTIFDIKQFSDNELWIATELDGIVILKLSEHPSTPPAIVSISYISTEKQSFHLSSSSIRSLYQDSFGHIWAGTWGGGINFIDQKPYRFKLFRDVLPNTNEIGAINKAIGGICVDKENCVWLGTEIGVIKAYCTPNGSENIVEQELNKELTIQSALCDYKGNIWFGLFMNGACYYDKKELRLKQLFKEPNQHIDVRTIYEIKPDTLWFGTSTGIYEVDAINKKVTAHYLTNQLIRAIYKDKQNQIWIGTYGNGLQIYNSKFQLIKEHNTTEGFPSNTINSIYEDKNGTIWIATGEGLACFSSGEKDEYIIYNNNSGLENIHIHSIIEDQTGNIWFSTNKGIGCYNKKKKQFYNYNEIDNVPTDGFLSGSVAIDSIGRIYFGSFNGVCYFQPERILEHEEVPPTIITEFTLFTSLNKSEKSLENLFLDLKEIRLKHKENNFSVTFNVQDYALANRVEYAYMLKGLENEWYPIPNNNSVTFRNIPPGNYKLQVKTRLRNQEWSDQITQLTIQINPPLWLTWWAKLLYLLLSTAIIATIMQMYNSRFRAETLYKLEKKKHQQEQELNDERLRFYTNITHELRTPLTLILGPLEDLLKQNSLSVKDEKKVSVIHQSAIRLLNLINQLLEFRKTETQNKRLCISRGNLTHLIFEIGLKYKELNQNSALHFSIQTSIEELTIFYDKEVITIILDNLISNAIKYTPRGKITLSLDREIKEDTSYAVITVQDTGHGIAPEALTSIYNRYYQANSEHQASGTGIGLSLVKNLVALHEAEIEVTSKLGEGSCFSIKLLIDNTYPHLHHIDSNMEEESNEECTDKEMNETSKQILLVVEDNPDIRSYIADSFSEKFDVRLSTNGKEGAEAALTIIPDIIVSDIMMPLMNGTALCEQLKKDVRTSHIPIILLTAKDTLQDKEDGYQAGADSYLTKPFSATLLQSRINNLLDSRRTLASYFGEKSELKEKKSAISSALNKIDDEFLTKINQLIEERMTEDKIDIGYLADKLCMSNSTLYRKMKALTGLSTNEYIRKVKMRAAERLLLEGKYTISEITFKMGFNSSVYFRQCFKEEFGMLPSEYIKQLTKSN